jgi:hypothetical protein
MSEPIDIAVAGAAAGGCVVAGADRGGAGAAAGAGGGRLHEGCKMVLSGTSRSNKSRCLLDLGVASGQKWWGRHCRKAPVLYINFETTDRNSLFARPHVLNAARMINIVYSGGCSSQT